MHCPNLQTLNLEENNINVDDGAKALADGLKHFAYDVKQKLSC